MSNLAYTKPTLTFTLASAIALLSLSVAVGCNGQTDSKPKQRPKTAAQQEITLPEKFKAAVVYSDDYLIDLGGLEDMHPFDIKKYSKIHKALIEDGLLTQEQTLKPEPLTDEQILLVQSERLLEGLKDQKTVAKWLEAEMLASAPVDLEQGVLQKFRASSGGTLLAARQALKHGIGINIGGGYHHAKPDRGEGFCVFADIPIAIRQLQKEGFIDKAVIVDVDVHQGNGTICCLDDDSTFTFSMHQGNIYPIPKEAGDLDIELDAKMGDNEYLEILKTQLPTVLENADADICFIVAGCDTLAGDPLAQLEMTHEGICKRDMIIIQHCVDRKIPVVYTTSGGYSKDAWKAQHKSIKAILREFGVADQK